MSEDGGIDVTLTVFRLAVCIFGVIGNCLVIFVITVLREYKKAITHWYVLQLALADTLFLLTIPFKVVEDFYDEWIFTGGMCKAKETLLFLNYYSSICFLMVMSIDRYIALCHGFSTTLQKLRTKRSAFVITFIVWIVSLLFCIPIISYSDKRGLEPNCKCQYDFPTDVAQNEEMCNETMEDCMVGLEEKEVCIPSLRFNDNDSESGNYIYPSYLYEDYSENSGNYEGGSGDMGPAFNHGCAYGMSGSGWTSYILFNFIAMFVIPFLLMSICYSLIALRLRQGRARRRSITSERSSMTAKAFNAKAGRKRTMSASSTRAERDRIRVTCVCLILVILFLLCWLPFHSVHLAKMHGIIGSSEYCAKLSAATTVLAYLNSALNPYIYNCIGTKFGKRLRTAAGSVRSTVARRTLSMSSSGGGTVRYFARKKSSSGESHATSTTQMYKGKIEIEMSNSVMHHEEGERVREDLTQK